MVTCCEALWWHRGAKFIQSTIIYSLFALVAFLVLARISVAASHLSVQTVHFRWQSMKLIYKPLQPTHLTFIYLTLLSLQTYQLCQCWSMAALSIWDVQRATPPPPAKEICKWRAHTYTHTAGSYMNVEKKTTLSLLFKHTMFILTVK